MARGNRTQGIRIRVPFFWPAPQNISKSAQNCKIRWNFSNFLKKNRPKLLKMMQILEIRPRIRVQHPRKHKNWLKLFKNFQNKKFTKILPKKSGETSVRGQGRIGPSLSLPMPQREGKTRGGLSLPLKNFFIF